MSETTKDSVKTGYKGLDLLELVDNPEKAAERKSKMVGEQKENLSGTDTADDSRPGTSEAGEATMRDMLAYMRGDNPKAGADITTLWNKQTKNMERIENDVDLRPKISQKK